MQNLAVSDRCACGEPLVTIGEGEFQITPPYCPECGQKMQAEYERQLQLDAMARLFEFSYLAPEDRGWLTPESVTAQGVEGARRAVAWRYNSIGLYMWGPAGTGKTVAAKHLVLRCLYHGKHACFVSVPGLLLGLGRPFASEDYKQATAMVKRATRYPLAVLDDLGAEQPTEKSREVLFSIIDGRIDRGLPTIFTSNLEPADLFERLSDGPGRIVDRIVGSCLVIPVEGESFRIQAARERSAV